MLAEKLKRLAERLDGELHDDLTMRSLYATDASAYRELPLAVAFPKTTEDLKKLVIFARAENTSLIPRTAGTSLAGQVVGHGIVVDMSRYFTRILEVNPVERWVRVQPGVIRDELNMHLKPYGLMFAPETSTANRAMIGGMVGNNSCGSNSVVYGTTRDHLLEVKAILSDGTEATFGPLDRDGFAARCQSAHPLEAAIYCQIRDALSDPAVQAEILREFPKKEVTRRNTGYALDRLLEMVPFKPDGEAFNFCKLIAGSEGTLALLTEIKLNLVPLPPREIGLICAHFHSIDESLRANVIAMKHKPSASELIDHYILSCTEQNLEYRKYSFFVEGKPQAILIIEFRRDTLEEVKAAAQPLIDELKQAGLGYAYPLITGNDTAKVWALRKAGLGLLGNIQGDDKPVPVIEDTAVSVEDLPAYIREFNQILQKYQLYSVHYAHAGSGELHLRPILNLKSREGQRMFRTIAEEIASLVKKYRGSLSGEHGDGRLRGEFIRRMVGEKNYALMRQLKYTWDPQNVFNPGKIIDTPPMDTMLRYAPDQKDPQIRTYFDFGPVSILQHAEQCNGTGECRKTHLSGGTMCPSYMATRHEKDTTRARANILREFLTHSTQPNRFNHKEIYEVMDLCLLCKGCKSECPSNVDVAKLKMEFLQQYHDANGVPLRSRMIAHFATLTAWAARVPGLYNFLVQQPLTARLFKQLSGFAVQRSLPLLHAFSLKKWFKERQPAAIPPERRKGLVYLFCDEFTNYQDVEAGMHTVWLLEALGYEVQIPEHVQSGRALLSKGFLRKARQIAEQNIGLLEPVVHEMHPLIGVEPSAILSFRDEYPDLVRGEMQQKARKLAAHCLLLEEFLLREWQAGRISQDDFTDASQSILLHGHCQQKALVGIQPLKQVLSFPKNYRVTVIPSGCCGMAGSFGYEKEHYDLSMKIGELVLFPSVRAVPQQTLIAAPGTSCRHQIKDGTGKIALHPATILWQAVKKTSPEH